MSGTYNTTSGEANHHAQGYYKQHSIESDQSSPRSQVNFNHWTEDTEERKKYLTAKYGAHQMRLIRKRLEVEDWIDKQLCMLYNIGDADDHSYSAEIDLDNLLDMEEDSERRKYILEMVADAKKTPDVVNKFVNELLLKAQTL